MGEGRKTQNRNRQTRHAGERLSGGPHRGQPHFREQPGTPGELGRLRQGAGPEHRGIGGEPEHRQGGGLRRSAEFREDRALPGTDSGGPQDDGRAQTGESGNRGLRFQRLPVAELTVALASAAIALLLGLIVLVLVRVSVHRQTAERRFNALKVLFLDPETDTYSLSKFQFYLWTAAALFGYAYLVIGRMLVQGQPWPEVPDNLPAVIAIGTGTSVGSQIATAINGAKGPGGEEH